MRSPSLVMLHVALVFAFAELAAADEPTKESTPAETQTAAEKPGKESAPADPRKAAEEAVRKAAADFREAFNSGNAEKVAALWTADAEYIDEDGRRYAGRDTIKKEFAEFFAANPNAKVRGTIDSIRLVSDTTAIEDGREKIDPPPAGAPGASRYTAVYVLQDEEWLLASVRDTLIPITSNYHELNDLEWLIGSWNGGKGSVQVESKCRWLGNKSFVERTYEVTDGGVPISSGKQIIGWDPEQQQIHSWTFTSESGHSQAVWKPHESGWWTQATGVLGDGTRTSSVIVLRKVDDDTLIWKSTHRTVGDARLPDMDEVVLKRVAEKH